MSPNPPGLFITGTNTEVGKTHVAALIVRGLRAAGPSGGRLQTGGQRVSTRR